MDNFKKSALAVLVAGAMGFSGSLFAADEKAKDAGEATAPAADSTAVADSSSAGATGNTHWGKIDSDSDNIVTPDEMEKFLQAKGSSGADSKAPGAAGPTGDGGAPAPASKEGMEKDTQSK